MRYCNTCVLPDTRPNLKLGADGVCNACTHHKTKPKIDWEGRKRSFEKVVSNAKLNSKGYDCLIPVSGGKDSTWQVIKCLEYGLKPLAVTWKTPARTEIGQQNLDNLVSLGVDHIDYQVSPEVEKKFMYESFKKYGSTAIPMHLAIFNIPLIIAIKFDIPLIVWGENSSFEYGGDDETKGFKLTGNWLKKFGVTHGTTAKDWVSENLSEKELIPYFGPAEEELDKKGVLAVFLGNYFNWDPEESLKVAQNKGFKANNKGAKTGYYNYADIDDDFISIHHWMKWYKFGFTRLQDNLSLEIRNGRMNREDAIKIIQEKGDETPHKDILKLCKFLEITKEHFFEIAETFRNKNIWFKENGVWKIKDFLIPTWSWDQHTK